MKWKALTLSLAALAMITLAIAGCGTSSTPTSAPPTSVNAGSATAPSPGGAPPSMAPGGVSDNRTPPSMDLSTAAKTLRVTENQLQNALGDSSRGPADLAAAALSSSAFRKKHSDKRWDFPTAALLLAVRHPHLPPNQHSLNRMTANQDTTVNCLRGETK